MKPTSIRWQFSSLSDSPCEIPNMPGTIRSDVDVTNFPMSGKMPAPNFLRLNSVGEVSAESFPEKVVRKGNLGISKSLDSISPSKNFSWGRPIHTDNSIKHSASQMGLMMGSRGVIPNYSQCPPDFSASPNIFWQRPACQFGMCPHYNQRFPHPSWTYVKRPFFPIHQIHNNPTMDYPYSPRIPGLLPGVMFTGFSAFPDSANTVPLTQRFDAGSAFQTFTPQKAHTHYPDIKAKTKTNESQLWKGAKKSPIKKAASSVNVEMLKNSKNVECSKSIENCVDKLDINDSVQTDRDNEQSVDLQIVCEKELPQDSNPKDNALKRRNEKNEEISKATGSHSKCSLANAIDLSSVLFLRKTPKKGRPSCKKRKKRQHVATISSQSSKQDMETVTSVTVSEPVQSQCVSPTRIESSGSSPSASLMQASIRPHDTSAPLKSRPSFVARLFCSPSSDSELSDNEDVDECDSVTLSCDLHNSLSPLSDLGSSLSFDTLFKPKNCPSLDTLVSDRNKCDSEQEYGSQSPASSPGPKKSLCFSLSFSVSEDEDSDLSFNESFSTSPSEQLILDFEFGNGLSLEAIIGKTAEKASRSSRGKCTDNEKPPSEQDALLLKINADWNKSYPSVPSCNTSLTDNGRVQFASEEDLVQVHIVGNEERRGTWREDWERFQKHIEDVGKVLSHIFSDGHRQKMREQLGHSSKK